MKQSGFNIIQASAGSGKTYTLVFRYLAILLSSNQPHPYRHMLALTFTNKAVNEMKIRILERLWELTQDPPKNRFFCDQLVQTLGMDIFEIRRRAKTILQNMLAEYGSFDVITLDKFAHRIVRVFAKEFNLPFGFEVATDNKAILQEMVQSIIKEVGNEDFITTLLTAFSLEKIHQEKSWDVQDELDAFSSLLLNENDCIPLADLQQKTRTEHLEDVKCIRKEIKNTKALIQHTAKSFQSLLDQNQLTEADFYKGLIFKHIDKVLKEEFNGLYKNTIEAALRGENSLYKKQTDSEKKEIIDALRPQLLNYFLEIKKEVGKIHLLEKTLKYWTPRVILQLMEERLARLQLEKEVQLLTGFNQKINKLVKQQEAPLIFERMGERYYHYFIDEFQDTSGLQWSNLIPLVSQAVEGEVSPGSSGNLLLVGDPKQAIYRWRGGDVQQFVDLLQEKSPFQIQPKVINLENNYRSGAQIVAFNNAFFNFASQQFHSENIHRFYGENSQQKTQKEGGFIRIEALPEGGNKVEKTPLYLGKTLETLREVLQKGYQKSEIAILVRVKEQAALLGAHLSEAGIATLSSDALVVANATQVQVLISLINLTLFADDEQQHKLVFDAFWAWKNPTSISYHSNALKCIKKNTKSFFNEINILFGTSVYWEKALRLPLIEYVDYWIEHLPFIHVSDSFVITLQEEIAEYCKTNPNSARSFLSHWKFRNENLRVMMPEEMEAVKIMTIHQAKGLEFPVVILPFLDTGIYPNVTTKVWYPFKEGALKQIQWGWINFSNDLKEYGETANELYEKTRNEQIIDVLNVLYVALTRPVEQLYIITQKTENKNTPSYALLINQFIKSTNNEWDENNCVAFGSSERNPLFIKEKQQAVEKRQVKYHISSHWKKQLVVNSQIDDSQLVSQNRGKLLHDIMAKVIEREDLREINKILDKEIQLSEAEKEKLYEKCKLIVNHPRLTSFFDGSGKVYCEKEILLPNGKTLRPDRINSYPHLHKATIIDYKTGVPKIEDKKQITSYQKAIQNMGFKHIENLIVYVNDEIVIQNVDFN